MTITRVDLYSANSEEAISFSLGDSDLNPRYKIRDMLGLDAEEIISKFYGSSQVTGLKFYNFEMKPRDIVIRVALQPQFRLGESYSDVRADLYRAISSNRTGLVTLHFMSGATTVARIVGSIIKFEVPFFTKLPEVQLTIHCNDPMLRAINPVIFTGAELSTVDLVTVPDSLSNAPHGFTMQVTFNDASAQLTIQDKATSPEWFFKIIPSGGFLDNDVLYISTEFSDKQIYIVRSSTVIQLVDKIEPQSIWPVMFPGLNKFYFLEQEKFDWDDLRYYPAYWGL